MKSNTQRVTIALVLAVILLIALYFIVRFTVDVQNRDTLARLDSAISNQEKQLITLAETTRVNGADTATERIVIDCNAGERERFDKLLDLLSSTIKPGELSELNTLFYKCGSFYADRKSVMATRLVREVEILAEYQALREILSDKADTQTTELKAWKNLAEAELKTAEYFNQLVILQGTIIAELTAGKSATSPSIVATLNEVSSVRGQMLILGKQIEVFKTEALTL